MVNEIFRKFATKTSEVIGSPWAFLIATLLIIVWAISGIFFEFSDTWQLIINTATTISTGLIVFLIQNTQNRDSQATHLKLNELLRALAEARTGFAGIQQLSDIEVQTIKQEFDSLSEEHRKDIHADI